MNYRIVEASPLYVGPIAKRMREASTRIEARGGKPRAWLRWHINQSMRSCIGFVNGEPVIIWGFLGDELQTEVEIWANFSEEVRRYPLTIIREAKAELDRVLETACQIHGKIIASDKRARRFAEFLGFTVWEDEPMNDNGVLCFPITKSRP